MSNIPSPDGYGWGKNNDGQFYNVWIACSLAPDEILNMMVGDYRKESRPPACPCTSAGITCIKAFSLKECNSIFAIENNVSCVKGFRWGHITLKRLLSHFSFDIKME